MLTRPEIETVETLVQVIDEENEARGIKDKRAREMMIQNLKKDMQGMRTTAAERAAEMREEVRFTRKRTAGCGDGRATLEATSVGAAARRRRLAKS